jgi:hypothetical protein
MSIIFQHYKQLTTLMEQQKVNDNNGTSGTLDLWMRRENNASGYSGQ